MKTLKTDGIIKLTNDQGRVVWLAGDKACATLNAAKLATGKSRDCKTVRRAAKVIVTAKIKTAIECGYCTLIEIEDDSRMGAAVNIPLEAEGADTIKALHNTQR